MFVAGFIGSPKMNLFHSSLRRGEQGGLAFAFGDRSIAIPAEVAARRPALAAHVDKPVTIGIRPEGLSPTTDAGPEVLEVTAEVVEMLGSETLVFFVAPVEQASDADVRDRAQASDEEESILAAEGKTVMCARLVPPIRIANGSPVRLSVDEKKLYFFDSETGQAIN